MIPILSPLNLKIGHQRWSRAVVNLVALRQTPSQALVRASHFSSWFSVLVAASAVDADGDTLTYEFAWGDESIHD